MKSHLYQLIDSFTDLDVLVIGDSMLDSYLEGSVDRLCREAPVPIVEVTDRRWVPGGAANTAANARSLAGRVSFLSIIGDDVEGAILCQALEDRGVSTEHLMRDPHRRTIAKHRVIGSSQMLLRFDEGSTDPIDREAAQTLIDHFLYLFPRCDAVIISDYGYGILTPQVVDVIAACQARRPRILVADSKTLAAYRTVGLTAVKPNYAEVLPLIGAQPGTLPPSPPTPSPNFGRGGQGVREGGRAEQIMAYEDQILNVTGAEIAAVTLDTEGAVIFERGSPPYRTYATAQPHSRAAGAGDTFVSALTLALAAGAATPTAAEIASAAAAVVVSKDGTTCCTADELLACLSDGEKLVTSRELLAARLDLHRESGRRIVFTNGCFDILHRGHIAYLNQAKSLGDLLVVGVNSDGSVQRLKGPTRPINTLEDRLQVLAALSCIDYLVPFEEDTPVDLIRFVRPDVFVKGGDYTRETLPEAPVVEALGGRVEILPYLADHSTTSIIDRIRILEDAESKADVAVPVPSRLRDATLGKPAYRRLSLFSKRPANRKMRDV